MKIIFKKPLTLEEIQIDVKNIQYAVGTEEELNELVDKFYTENNYEKVVEDSTDTKIKN